MQRIAPAVFKRYVEADLQLKEMFESAEQRGYDTLADLLINPFDNIVFGDTDVKKIKLICDNIKWFLSRKRPQQYGDKSVVEHQITADRAIIDAMQQGKQRAIKGVVEGVAYEVVEEAATTALPPELLQFVGR